jgi:predicted glycoside hydrolase/deacetylase ChbG (UPF0249 family)
LKTLTLVADDFGLAPAVDRGIVALAAAQRLSAVSCIVTAPGWAMHWAALAATGVRCGLHFNLTEGRPLSPALAALWPQLPGLPRLMVLAFAHRLPLQALADELAAQWAAFVATAGCAPAHLDGHQHVHHLPGVRSVVLRACAAHPSLRVRATGRVRGPGWGLKRALIAGTGGTALARQLHAQGQAQNDSLFGAYDFAHADYRGLMQGWLQAAPAVGGLLFCHPGDAPQAGDRPLADPIASARQRELAYLRSPAFTEDMESAQTMLQR